MQYWEVLNSRLMVAKGEGSREGKNWHLGLADANYYIQDR